MSAQQVPSNSHPSDREESETPSSRLRKEMKSYFDALPADQSDSFKEETKVQRSSHSRSRDRKNKSKSKKDAEAENNKSTEQGKKPKQDNSKPSIDRQSSASGTQRKRRNAEADLYFKTRICPQFVSGLCERGSKCTYAHGQSELRQPKSNGRMRVCFKFEQGLCKKSSDQCRFEHFIVQSRFSQTSKREPEKESKRLKDSSRDREVDKKKSHKVQSSAKNELCDYNRAYEIRNPNPVLAPPNVSNQKSTTKDERNSYPHQEHRYPHYFVPQMPVSYGHPGFVSNSSGYIGSTQPFPIYGQPYYMNYPPYEGQYPPIESSHVYFDKTNHQKVEYPPFNGKLQYPPLRFDNKQPAKYEPFSGDQKNIQAPYSYVYPPQPPQPQQPYSISYGPSVGVPNYPMPYYPPYGYDYSFGADKAVGQNSNGSNSLKRGPVSHSFDPRNDGSLKNDKPEQTY